MSGMKKYQYTSLSNERPVYEDDELMVVRISFMELIP